VANGEGFAMQEAAAPPPTLPDEEVARRDVIMPLLRFGG